MSSHPALAGKIAGGYDFVNEDDDPMDDNRHGTHVAGIIAASGPAMTGVARTLGPEVAPTGVIATWQTACFRSPSAAQGG